MTANHCTARSGKLQGRQECGAGQSLTRLRSESLPESGTVGYAVTVRRDRDSLRRRHSESQTPLWVAGPGPALPAGGTAGPPPMPALVARRLVSSQLPRLATGRVAVTNGYPHSMFATVTLGYRSGLRVSHGHSDRRRPGSGRAQPGRPGHGSLRAADN